VLVIKLEKNPLNIKFILFIGEGEPLLVFSNGSVKLKVSSTTTKVNILKARFVPIFAKY
jgi:hypothetical protein